MLLEEFDVKKYENTIREEGREECLELMSRLAEILINQNRSKDLQRAFKDSEYRKRLLKEIGL